MPTKICTKCKEPKDVSEFVKNKTAKDGLDYSCKTCQEQYYQTHKIERAEYIQNNKVKIAKRQKRYQQDHKAEIAEQKEQYYQDHKAEIVEYQKEYHQKHKADKVEYDREYYQARREERIAYNMQYDKDHKAEKFEYYKKYRQTEAGKAVGRKGSQKHRALKMGVECEVFDPKEIFERDGYRCQLCGKKTRPDYKNPNHPLYPNLDHIVPLSKGGSHTRLNTQCLCRQCNITKNNSGVGDQFRMF